MKKSLFIILLLFALFVIPGCEMGETPSPVDPPHIIHMDDDDNNICDICGEVINKPIEECQIHMDDDNDNICDICGKLLKEIEVLEGIYTLSCKTVSNVDISDAYLTNYLKFQKNEVVYEVIVDATGKTTNEGTYELKGDELKIKMGSYEYTYLYNKEEETISYDGLMSKRKVNLTYSLDVNYIESSTAASGSVAFTDELFGDDINKNFYNYCPSIILEDNQTMHIWYCGNKDSGNVTDYIMHRVGKLQSDGSWLFSDKDIALTHGESGTWDSRHACDPSVTKGVFAYQGTTYYYLMAYLGCETSDGGDNEVGIAVSVTPNGPWKKVGNQTKAFRSYIYSTEYALYENGSRYWGYGQPSVMSVDKEGKVLLFYTKGIKLGTYTYVEEWDFSNLDNPELLRETKLGDGGAIGIFNNADFAYDPVNNCIYCIKEDHINGWYPSDGGVNWISASNSIFYVSCLSTDNEFCDCLFRNHSWAKVITIGKSATSFDRVHNCGIVTDSYGRITNYERIGIVYTMSELATSYPNWNKGGQWPALHTYRLHGFIVER